MGDIYSSMKETIETYANANKRYKDIVKMYEEREQKYKADIAELERELRGATKMADKYIDRANQLEKEVIELEKTNDMWQDKYYNKLSKPVTKKVKKEVTKWVNIYEDCVSHLLFCAFPLFDSEEKAILGKGDNSVNNTYLYSRPITITEEVEEVIEPVLVERWINIYSDGEMRLEKSQEDGIKIGKFYADGYVDTIKLTGYYYPKGK